MANEPTQIMSGTVARFAAGRLLADRAFENWWIDTGIVLSTMLVESAPIRADSIKNLFQKIFVEGYILGLGDPIPGRTVELPQGVNIQTTAED